MSKTFTVNFNGRPVKSFGDQIEASKFMVEFVQLQQLYQKQFDYVDQAVLQSDLSASKQTLQRIMEIK